MKASRRKRELGAANVWLACTLGILILFTTVTADTAYVVWAGEQVEVVTDAATRLLQRCW